MGLERFAAVFDFGVGPDYVVMPLSANAMLPTHYRI